MLLEEQTGKIRIRSAVVGAALAFTLVSCGSGESDRDQAISALDRTTQASALETEMASLVAGVPDDPNAKQGQNINASVEDLDNQAETILASTGTGKSYDEKISAAVNETRGAGNEITSAVGQTDQLGKARTRAIGRLTGSNRNLKEATGLIGKDLADEQGNLTAEDADAIGQTVAAVGDSEKAVIAAAQEVIPIETCPVPLGANPSLKVRGISCAEGQQVADKAFEKMCDKVCGKIDLNVPELQSIDTETSFDGWTCTGNVYHEGHSEDCVNGLNTVIHFEGV